MPGKVVSTQDELNRAMTLKAEAEAKLLARQLQPAQQRFERMKSIAGMSGALLAAIALISAVGSIFSWFGDREEARQTQADERLQRGLTLLGGESPSACVAGLSSLRGFASAEEPRAMQMLVAVANALAVEPDPRVRAAQVAFFEEAADHKLPAGLLQPAFRALVGANRLAVKRTRSWYVNPTAGSLPAELQEGGELDSEGKAIAALLRAGARGDLSGTYLRNVDLAGLDLGATRFQRADLSGASLSRAKLAGSDFRSARLTRTNFSHADLRRTNFSLPSPQDGEQHQHNFILTDLLRAENPLSLPFAAPSFRCADLRGADFRDAFIFIDVGQAYADRKFHDFSGADLADAEFGRPGLWRVLPKSQEKERFQQAIWGGWGFDLSNGGQVQVRYVTDNERGIHTDSSFYEKTGFDALTVTTRLGAARWQDSKLPSWAKAILRTDALKPAAPDCTKT